MLKLSSCVLSCRLHHLGRMRRRPCRYLALERRRPSMRPARPSSRATRAHRPSLAARRAAQQLQNPPCGLPQRPPQVCPENISRLTSMSMSALYISWQFLP